MHYCLPRPLHKAGACATRAQRRLARPAAGIGRRPVCARHPGQAGSQRGRLFVYARVRVRVCVCASGWLTANVAARGFRVLAVEAMRQNQKVGRQLKT